MYSRDSMGASESKKTNRHQKHGGLICVEGQRNDANHDAHRPPGQDAAEPWRVERCGVWGEDAASSQGMTVYVWS